MTSFDRVSVWIIAATLLVSCSTQESSTTDESAAGAEASQVGSIEEPEQSFDKLTVVELETMEIGDAREVLTVEAQFKGARGLFLVDTSASNHVLTREFAESHDIIFTEPTEPVEGEAALGSAPTSAVETAILQVGDDRISADEVVAKPAEAVFRDLPDVEAVDRLAGVISLQNLYDTANRYTALDLSQNKVISVEASPTGLKAWLRVEFGARTFHDVERREAVAPELPQVVAELDGGDDEAVVLLDTTASQSVFKSSDLGVGDRQMECMEGGPEGCELRGVRVPEQTVEFGDAESPEFTAVGATSTLEETGVDGIIGRDAMKHFVWVFPADDHEPLKVARAGTKHDSDAQ